MNKNIKTLLLTFTLAILFYSCKDSKESNQKVKTETTTKIDSHVPLSAKIDGVLFNAFELGSNATKLSFGTFGTLNIMSVSEEGEAIGINIPIYKGIGKYEFGIAGINRDNPMPNSANYAIRGSNDRKAEGWSSKEGVVEIIEEKNGRMKGVFNFSTMRGTQKGEAKKITEGKFDLKVK